MMRAGYERIGDRQFDREALIRVGEGFVVIDHVAVSAWESGVKEVYLGVDGDVPLGALEMNVPALGKLVGEVGFFPCDCHPDEKPTTLVYKAHRAPKPPPLSEEDIMRIMSERKKSGAGDSDAQG